MDQCFYVVFSVSYLWEPFKDFYLLSSLYLHEILSAQIMLYIYVYIICLSVLYKKSKLFLFCLLPEESALVLEILWLMFSMSIVQQWSLSFWFQDLTLSKIKKYHLKLLLWGIYFVLFVTWQVKLKGKN